MKTAILGLPNSGKTTIYNALTGKSVDTSTFSTGRLEPNLSIVRVPDPRIAELAAIYQPRKITQASVQIVDVAGFTGEERTNETLAPEVLNFLRTADALIHVVRFFESADVPHPLDEVDPERDYRRVEGELIFSDLIVVEKRMERLEKEARKLKGKNEKAHQAEFEALLKVKAHLEQELPVRTLDLAADAEKLLRGFQFLSAKPVLVVLNVSEDQLGQDIPWIADRPEVSSVLLSGKIEAELAQMEADDAAEFMADLGLRESARDRVIRKAYVLLGLISFFTVGEDEVRAWTIVRGATAAEAGGAIHSDIEKGFIRAEVVPWNQLVSTGSMAEAKRAGVLRLEGRSYEVRDGDISHFRFNV